ncbi:MAG: hypothetical protein RLZZ540_281 [Bacteroidota bacterium]
MMYDGQLPFVSSWNTANTSTGSSTSTQIKLPLISSGTYNFVVNWGDGNSDTITAYNAAAVTHTYSSSGTYTIIATGTCTGWQFNNTGDRLKILSISSWGTNFKLGTTQGGYFYGCSNLNLSSVSDTLNLTGTTDLLRTFRGCTSITSVNKFTDWNTGLIINFREMFLGCTNFNQNVGALNVSGAGNIDSFFMNCTAFNNGGSSSINNWNVSNVGSFGSSGQGTFAGCTSFNQPLGNWNVSGASVFLNMFSGATIFNQDIGGWNVVNGTNFNGMFQGATAFNNGGSSSINNWNTSNATSMSSMFQSASAFNQNIGSWNVSAVTSFLSMFQSATVFNNGSSNTINNWSIKTTGTITMRNMFQSASSFNQPIYSWNTVAVTTMASMFNSATQFNNGYANGVAGTMAWNMAAITTANSMFSSATNFNQDLGSLVLTSCTNLASMFQSASKFNNGGSTNVDTWTLNTTTSITLASMFQSAVLFNQPLNSWNISKATSTASMFQSANAFNQNISSWNVAACTNMSAMFQSASAFNNGLANGVAGNMVWSVGTNMTTIYSMFNGATAFNQNLGVWNLSNCSTLINLFGAATKYNNGGGSGINSWTLKTTGTLDLSSVFAGTAFNQDISSWNTIAVTNMSGMFNGTVAFNQNIGSWNVSAVTNFTNFMNGKAAANYSSTNLDAIYNGWTNRIAIAALTTTFATIKYTAAATEGRALLTRTNSTKSITNAVNNGSGLIRISATAHGLSTGNKCFISGVVGTTEANGSWIVTVVDANTIDLNSSTFTNTYSSAGTLITGYGWTVTDGGI